MLHWEYRQYTMTGVERITEDEALACPFPQTVERRQVGDWEKLWVKPKGCVCAGPSDPYHSWCSACNP